MTRLFTSASAVSGDTVTLALAPALTPAGLVPTPRFFSGFPTHPQVLARGLVTLADISATHYFTRVPTGMHDPVLTAHGDRLRAECFSACNGVYARLDLLGEGFDGGDIGYGTTNVDVGPAMRTMLSAIAPQQLVHLDVGADGLRVSTVDAAATERPVDMPDRWVRGLGNAAELHHGLQERFRLSASAARTFIVSLPAGTGTLRSGWLTPVAGGGVRVAPLPSAGGVHVTGLHRLSALKRLLTHVRGMSVSGPAGGEVGPTLVTVDLPSARLTLGLTEEAWRGYSGEGALLSALAEPTVLEDADLVSVLLAFEPVIDVQRLSRGSGLSEERVRSAVAALASSGRVGWDDHDGAWFHRELPDDPDRVTRDNPRLVAARGLVDEGAVRLVSGADEWRVRSAGVEYVVRLDPSTMSGATPAEGARCTCAWYLHHTGGRGACKHVLAVQLYRKDMA